MTDQTVPVLLRGRPNGPEEADVPASVVLSPMVYDHHEYERDKDRAFEDGRAVLVHTTECCGGHRPARPRAR